MRDDDDNGNGNGNGNGDTPKKPISRGAKIGWTIVVILVFLGVMYILVAKVLFGGLGWNPLKWFENKRNQDKNAESQKCWAECINQLTDHGVKPCLSSGSCIIPQGCNPATCDCVCLCNNLKSCADGCGPAVPLSDYGYDDFDSDFNKNCKYAHEPHRGTKVYGDTSKYKEVTGACKDSLDDPNHPLCINPGDGGYTCIGNNTKCEVVKTVMEGKWVPLYEGWNNYFEPSSVPLINDLCTKCSALGLNVVVDGWETQLECKCDDCTTDDCRNSCAALNKASSVKCTANQSNPYLDPTTYKDVTTDYCSGAYDTTCIELGDKTLTCTAATTPNSCTLIQTSVNSSLDWNPPTAGTPHFPNTEAIKNVCTNCAAKGWGVRYEVKSDGTAWLRCDCKDPDDDDDSCDDTTGKAGYTALCG